MKHAPASEARLTAYRELLLRWNERINLISEHTAEAVDQRHIADCLQLAPLLPQDGPIGDLGSGAGLPGLVLAALAPEREVHLVEASATLQLPKVRVHPLRIEKVKLPPLAAVTARALAPLVALLPHAERFLAPGGVAIFPKGRNAEKELTEAASGWHFTAERFASVTDPEATIFRLSDIHRAPK